MHGSKLNQMHGSKLNNASSGSDSKESACNAGGLGLIPGFERSPGEENGDPLQYSCLENSMDRSLVGYSPYEVTKSQTQLND